MKSTVNITLWIVAAVLIAGASFGLGYVFGGDKIAGEKKNANTTNTASTTASPTNEGQVDATVKQYSGVYSFSATVREVDGTRLTVFSDLLQTLLSVDASRAVVEVTGSVDAHTLADIRLNDSVLITTVEDASATSLLTAERIKRLTP